ncbi:hypothetical protein AB0F81_34520 [Actinoplanes sp. NPDC024001]|uniref:hypothetical protein n=1 Tax=Actinoplanes sp. NPDC024001 TaxID=3154598 RepID=UPI0033F5EA16
MRRVLIAGGVLVIGCAVIGAAGDPDVDQLGVLVFLMAVVVLHDAVFLPLVLVAGAVISRVVPEGRRATVRAAGVVCLAVTVVALPLVLGFGRTGDNPTVLPRSYPIGLVVIVALVAGVAVVCRKGIERSRARRRGRPPG